MEFVIAAASPASTAITQSWMLIVFVRMI